MLHELRLLQWDLPGASSYEHQQQLPNTDLMGETNHAVDNLPSHSVSRITKGNFSVAGRCEQRVSDSKELMAEEINSILAVRNVEKPKKSRKHSQIRDYQNQ